MPRARYNRDRSCAWHSLLAGSAIVVRHLHRLSLAITAAGILLAIIAGVLGLSATWMLTGVLLAWAGIIKVIVVAIWRHAGIGEPASPTPDGSQSSSR